MGIRLFFTLLLSLSTAIASATVPLTFKRQIADCLGIYVVVDVTFNADGSLSGKLLSIGFYNPCNDKPGDGQGLVPVSNQELLEGLSTEEIIQLLESPTVEERAYLSQMTTLAKPTTLRVFPNPSGKSFVNFTLTTKDTAIVQLAETGNVKVYALDGRVIAEQSVSLAEQVEGTIHFKSDLVPGYYSVIVEANGKLIGADVLVVK